MNSLEELKQELKNLENKINELENRGNNNYKRKRFDYDEYYWFLNCIGESVMASDYYEDEDNFNYKIGNYFEIEEQAENYKEKILIEQELRDIAMELNKVERIDWNNNNQYKYYLCYDFSDDTITDYNYNIFVKKQGAIYCLDKNFKNVAIERIGEERLAKYLKGELD